ncbi:uncharacterized protein LOC133721340 isoform X1 [Rosa rugosa]|uniref:uncharacterized protein LOC133721340 isoform X1 n=2 Tax=Rosa rugosa TaxID=74645 RepID=UPI002B415427|nr:uncharacterized protein LOC133721340 isoform X1 [Rosa rugosa]
MKYEDTIQFCHVYEKSTSAFANSMMGRNLTHYSEPSVQDHGSPRSRNPSRKSQSRTERSPTRHRKSHRGSSPPSEKYSIRPKSPKHARSPSARSPFPQTKRLRRAEAGGVPEREQERINGRGIGRSLQEGGSEGDVGSDRTEKFSGRNDTDGNTSRSRHGTSPSDRDRRSRHRHSPQHAGDTRDEEKVNEGRNRNHSRGNDRSRENETERMERMTAKDSTGHMSSRSRHDTSPSDQHRRSRHIYYSPQHACDTRYGEKVIESRERNHSRGNYRSMHMENETERMERMTAKESTSHWSSRSRHNNFPSDRHRSRHRSHSPQHTGDTREKGKVIEGRERNHSRGNYRSMRWENDTERIERMTAKESTGHRSSRSRHGSSPSDRHRSSRHRYHSPYHAGDTRDKEKVIEGCQRNYRRENDRSMHREKHSDREYETERMETRTAKDSSGHRSSRSRHGQSTSPLNGHHKNRHGTHSSQQVADIRARDEGPESREAKDGIEKNDSVAMMSAAEEVLEAQKKQNPSFELSGKLAMETNRFRGDSYKKNLLSSSNYDGDEDYDNERTRGICRLNLAPRKKKLLVFDLNGLLVYRVFCFNKSGIPRDRTPDGKCGNHLVFKRAFAEEFMLFCLERFEVGIWTSALEKNVDGVLDCVMEKLRSRLIFVWDQHQCTDSGFKSLETKMKPLFFKELKRVWDHFEGKFSASDTLLIDDQPYKALLNPPYTGIFLDPYIPDNGTDNALDPKKELGKFLAGLAFADDVQLYVKDNPFGQPAISSEHPDWNFYSHVLRKLGKDLIC